MTCWGSKLEVLLDWGWMFDMHLVCVHYFIKTIYCIVILTTDCCGSSWNTKPDCSLQSERIPIWRYLPQVGLLFHLLVMHKILCCRPDGHRCSIDSLLNDVVRNTDPHRIRSELYSEESNLRLFELFKAINPVDFDQLFGLVTEENGRIKLIRATTLQLRISGSRNLTTVAERWEDMFISWSNKPRNDTLDVSVFTSDS